jgi:hypothetical protein
MFWLSLVHSDFCHVAAVFRASLSNTDLTQPRSFTSRPGRIITIAILFVLMQIAT